MRRRLAAGRTHAWPRACQRPRSARRSPSTTSTPQHAQRDRLVAIFEAILLSVVALLAAWSGYSAAKWGTESSLSLAKASSTRSKASVAADQGDADPHARLRLVQRGRDRLRLGRREALPRWRSSACARAIGRAFEAWLATHPLKNPNAPPDPSYLPQYRIPQEAQGRGADREGRPLLRGRPVGRGHGRQVRAADGLPGGGAVPRRHRQPLPGARGALRPGRASPRCCSSSRSCSCSACPGRRPRALRPERARRARGAGGPAAGARRRARRAAKIAADHQNATV